MRYIIYFFILFLIGCSMNTTSYNINNKDKVCVKTARSRVNDDEFISEGSKL